ncbi:hypothetical protein PybrP1_012555 [[Pythium] brassicae (nom. inval.)]|nr:hypothetical protein PybrP1_012555 [[Pythium] brassicae (nom. inval.)]
MTSAAALPAPLFRLVLAFVCGGDDALLRLRHAYRPVPPLADLRRLALVAKDWTAPVREVFAEAQLSHLTIALTSTTRAELENVKRAATLRGSRVRSLNITFGAYDAHQRRFFADTGLHFVDDTPLPWREIFARLPALRRLDISRVPLSSPHVAAILDAASTSCVGVEALLLPGSDGRLDGAGSESVASIYAALEKWSARGTGLRHLSFPSRLDADRLLQNTDYVANVSALCPNVEFLDGYERSIEGYDRLTCADEWTISRATWERFNQRCTRLKEFNWIVAPFSDDFFRVFGAHRKPALESLTFAVNMLWDWGRYFFALGDADRGSRPCYGRFATDPKAALPACPALRKLDVCFYHPVDEELIDDPAAVFEEEDFDFLVHQYPADEVFNVDVFGDAFCAALAANCPLLERLSMREVAERYNRNLVPILRFTDRGLVALSKLEWLQTVELRSINCSERGLFALLNEFPRTFGGQRDLQISLGGASPGSQLSFYHTVSKLLELLAKATDAQFVVRRVVLQLHNASLAPVDPDWSRSYLRKLEALIEKVKQQHPSLTFRCGINGRKSRGFARIVDFGLFTSRATPSAWLVWDHDTTRAQLERGDVFYDCGSTLHSHPTQPDPPPEDDYFYNHFDYGDHVERYNEIHAGHALATGGSDAARGALADYLASEFNADIYDYADDYFLGDEYPDY